VRTKYTICSPGYSKVGNTYNISAIRCLQALTGHSCISGGHTRASHIMYSLQPWIPGHALTCVVLYSNNWMYRYTPSTKVLVKIHCASLTVQPPNIHMHNKENFTYQPQWFTTRCKHYMTDTVKLAAARQCERHCSAISLHLLEQQIVLLRLLNFHSQWLQHVLGQKPMLRFRLGVLIYCKIVQHTSGSGQQAEHLTVHSNNAWN